MAYTSTDQHKLRSQKVTLSVPKQAKAPEGSFLTNVKEIKRWVNQLPVANIGETARQVYSTLASFNRIQVPTLVRAEIIELFREPVRYINTNITKHYLNVGFPLSKKASKAVLLAGELCNELSTSYKIVFLEQTLGNEENFNKKLIIISAQRALQYMKQQMFHRWLTYQDYKHNAWQEAHYLYTWAYQNQIHQIGVKEDNKFAWRKKAVESIEEVYLGMVLIASTNPYALTQSQLRRLHGKLPEWVKLTEIKPLANVDYNAGIFYLNLWSDDPPQKSLSPAHQKDSRFMAVDLASIISEARMEFESSDWESPVRKQRNPDLLSRTLLKLLIQTWNKTLNRKHSRTLNHHEVEALVGGNNLLRVLEKNREDDIPQPQTTRPKPQLQPSSSLTWNDSVFSTLSISTPTSSGAGGDSIFADSLSLGSSLLGPKDGLGQNPTTPAPPHESVHVLLTYNESVGGYCFKWKNDQPVKVRVGDVLGIRSQTNKEEYGIAVCRWIKSKEESQLFVGVQLLSPKCNAVTVTPFRSSASHRKGFGCFLLSGNALDNGQQSLISITQAFELDSVMSMVTEFGKHRIKITRLVESNHNFIHYQFIYADNEELQDSSPETLTEDLKDIWDEL